MVYDEQYSRYVGMVEDTIEQLLPKTEEFCPDHAGVIPQHLCDSMRYSPVSYTHLRAHET